MHLLLVILLGLPSLLSAYTLDPGTERIDLLPHCDYFTESRGVLGIDEVRRGDHPWQRVGVSVLSSNFEPKLVVWLRCELHNPADTPLVRMLEFDDAITGHVSFFDPQKSFQEIKKGQMAQDEKSRFLKPVFELRLAPYSTQAYYLRVHSPITANNAALLLWQKESLLKKEFRHQNVLSLFFGGMIALLLYNAVLLIFTRDQTYFWYVGYMVMVIIHQLLYTNMITPWVSAEIKWFATHSGIFFPAALDLFALQFTRSFLGTKAFPALDRLLRFCIYVMLFCMLFLNTWSWYQPQVVAFLWILLFPVMLFAGLWMLRKRSLEARYYVAGWGVLLGSLLSMALMNIGVSDLFWQLQYMAEVGIFSEAVLFSIGLAARINRLKHEKEAADTKLIMQQKSETRRLESEVQNRTSELQNALNERELLLRELHHRVKNNLATVISLLRLQRGEMEDATVQEKFLQAENRIGAMSKLHERLYRQKEITHLDTRAYIESILQEIKESHPHTNNITMTLDIKAELPLEVAICCGLIINELVTNACKHAFGSRGGHLSVTLCQHEEKFELMVKDDGCGFDPDAKRETLGLLLVRTLVERQLGGKMEVESTIDDDGGGGTCILLQF